MLASSKKAAAWIITAAVVLVALVTTAFSFGPAVEQALLPPIFKDVKASFVEVSPVRTILIVSGTKQRSCFLITAKALVQTEAGWVSGEAQMLNQDGSPLTADRQRIAVGQHFVRLAEIKPGGKSVKLDLEVRCHPLWVSRSILVEVSNPDPALVR